MNDGVPLSVDLDFKDATDRKCIAAADCLDLRPGQKSSDGRVGPDSEVRVVQRRGPQSVRNEVIDMFVSDQNGVRQRPTGLSIGGRMVWLRWRAKLEATRLSTEEGSPMTMQQFPIDGSVNGSGGGDGDRQYLLVGWRPRVAAAYPFSTRQLARLMILRSRIEAGLVGVDDMSEPDGQEPL